MLGHGNVCPIGPASSVLYSRLTDFGILFCGTDVTVNFGQKGPKLNSIPVYCLRLYGTSNINRKIILNFCTPIPTVHYPF